VHVVVEDRLLGTAGGVRNALDQLDADRFFVLYGDVLLDADLDEMRAMHRRSAAEATLAAYPSATVAGKGVLEIDGTGRVLRFAEKERVSGGGLVNAGLYLLESDFVARLAPRIELDFGHHVLPEAVDRGAKVFAYRLTRPVIDVGTPEGLAQARELARAHDTSGLS